MKKEELEAILFYMGDEEIVQKKIYQGGNKAYNTINALLHEGIQNEIDLFKENRNIEIFDSNHLKSYISLIVHIYHAMIKYQKKHETNTISYKIDRYSTIEKLMKTNKIEGFFSTCKYGYLEEYAHIKKDVILLEIIKDKDVPYVDYEELFKEKYSKSEEAEILIPFDTKIESINEIELTNIEKEKYYDMNGQKPLAKYQIKLIKNTYDSITYQRINEELLTCDKTVSHLRSCLNQLKNNQTLSKHDLEFYCEFKNKFIQLIRTKIKIYETIIEENYEENN